MLEIIALFFLGRDIWRLAKVKGLNSFTWVIYFILGWLFLEFIGIIFGLILFGKNNLISVELLAIAFAISSYFITKTRISKMPDVDDDIDHIGQS